MAIRYKRRALSVELGSRTTVQLPPRIFRVRLTGLLFETNKTFLLPGAMEGIRGLVDFYGSHPDMALVITGHADRVGSAWHNLALSEERAQSMAFFLRDAVEDWLTWYRGTPSSGVWGLREDQHMLTAVVDASQQSFYPGVVHGQMDAQTRDAIQRFQASRGLEESGSPNEDTRRELVRAYMSLDGTTLPEGAAVEQLGCGEHHNAVETVDGVDEQENRRVEIFLFDSGEVQPPTPNRCPGSGCAYEDWLAATIETIDFEDGLADLLVQVTGQRHEAELEVLAEARVELIRNGFPTRTATSDGNGHAVFAGLTSGTWSVHATKDDFDSDTREVEVHPGGFVLAGAETETGQGTQSNFAGTPSSTPASVAGGAVVMHLKDDRFMVRWIDEPAITPAAQEEAHNWTDDRVVIHPNASPAVSTTDTDADGVFFLPRGPSTKARLEEVVKTGPHRTAVTWRVPQGIELLPGKVADLPVSTRLRMSAWVFHSPFVKRISGDDDIILDEESVAAMGESCLDDLSIVSTIGWVEGSNPPKVGWRDHRPGGSEKRSAKYLAKVVNALHAHGIQVQAGWSSVDLKTGSSPYNRAWTKFLATATPGDIQTLAESALQFFASRGIDIDGIGFDFEINSLGVPQAANLALLYQKTAEVFRDHKRDAFVTYANAPFDQDGQGKPGFMNVQPFALARDVPNLFARPMCFDEHTISAGEIRKGVACAVRQASSNSGGGLHPAQAQFGLFARELDNAKEFESLVTDTLRPNRIGLMLYQLPKFRVINSKKGIFDRTPVLNYLADCRKWNDLLNPDEALPRTEGQPLQVPRTVDFGI